jgi:wobble nucleotide-excising tRNase
MKKDYQTTLLEEIRDQNKAILEGQKDQATRADMHRIEERLDVLESDVQVIKQAVKATNSDVAALSREVEKHKGLPAHVAHGHA